ncbi:MAG: ABC transporter permease, partial [Chloroflexota bacterium]
MNSLIRAEWKKITGNTRLMISLVWIFPIMTAIALSIGIVISLFSDGFGAFMGKSEWTNDIISIWGLINSFPGNIFTRLPIIAFMAMVFAGEYEWGTWKNVVPRNSRYNLIFAKLITLVAIVMMSLLITSVIAVLMQYLAHLIEGISYGPKFTADIALDTFRTYLIEAALTAYSLLLLGTFTAISAMLTRSVVGSLLLS